MIRNSSRRGRAGSTHAALLASVGCLALLMGPAAAQVSVKVGVLNDMSGVYSDIGGKGSVVAAQLAVEDFAKHSKDVTVEVVSADHQNKPDVGASIARSWYDRDGVDAILDVPTSSVALAVSQITHEKNKIFIDSGAGSTDLTGSQCSPNTVHWTYDTYALANGTGSAMIKRGGDTWYFLTADYAFGQSLQNETAAVVTRNGGKVIGSAKTPFPSADFSSYLLQAQGSGAKVIGLANAGGDTINAVKQAREFGIVQGGQKLAALLFYVLDAKALGLETAQGLVLTEAFYWDLNAGTRQFSEQFAKRTNGNMPTMNQAGVYAGLMHYLKAVVATKSKDAKVVMEWMKANPTDDPLFGKGMIRADGRKIHDMYLFEVKAPAASKGPWDLYNRLATIPGEQAFKPMSQGGCPLVGKM